MRRTALSISLLTLVAVFVIGAQNCNTSGPAEKAFVAGSLVIPMDNCYQRRDTTTPSQNVAWCTASAGRDAGVFRAYGLVYFLLKHGVTVYWAIDGATATAKTTVTGVDVSVSAPSSGSVAQKMSWTDGTFSDLVPAGNGVNYLGGPFIIAAEDADKVVAMLTVLGNSEHADFAQFQTEHLVDIHKVQNGFTANQVRPISGTPPKIAILNISGPKTSAGVMINYAKAAGFNWSCNGACTSGSDCDCAGGISKKDAGCTKASIQSKYGITVNDGPGKVYDILCDEDFLPDYTISSAPDFTKATLLRKDEGNAYKLLWAPHWESKRPTDACTDGTANPPGQTVKCGTIPDPGASIGSGQRDLADTLTCINAFVAAGNNLFAECHAIVTLEGGYGLMDTASPIKEYGRPATQFQATSKMNRSVSSGVASVNEFLPVAPYMQIGDFTFANVGGNVSAYLPDPSGNSTFSMPGSDYKALAEHYITQTGATGGSPNLDVLTGLKQAGEGATGGAVVYLGGHDYSSQTAGTRIVLNTLFSLGFGCADPNTECTAGQGACASGHLKCVSGGVQCVPDTASSVEACDGIDNNCNGQIDEGGVCNPPVCNSGDTDSCYDGPDDTEGVGTCQGGTRTCSGGAWGPCTGQVLPTPEVCNNKDDDCDGNVDGAGLCGAGATCTGGVCLPDACNGENSRCPTGFTCSAATCIGIPCPTSACGAGTVCQDNQCVDPCAGVTCGQGSACSGGVCLGGGCALTGCSDTSKPVCVNGTCVADPCAAANCPTGAFCRLGDCVRSCSYVECAPGQQCSADGFCESTCDPACGAGQVCANGSCVADPCAGVTCGASQICQGGSCIDDPCGAQHVICTGALGTCSAGQCVGGDVKKSETKAVAAAKGGGCGSTGGGGLLSVFALLAVVAWRRGRALRPQLQLVSLRRGTNPRAARVRATVAMTAAALVAGATATGCSNGSSGPSCKDGQSACGSACVDLSSAADNCGVCGRACAAGFVCVAKGCSMDTGNPYLRKVEPATLGQGDAVTLQLSGDEFKDGATVRVTGPGTRQQVLSLGADGKTSSLDLTGYDIGNALVRVVNPPNLVSNAVTVPIQLKSVLRGIVTGSPARDASSVQQDNTSAVSLTLVGASFADGAVATLTGPLPGTASQNLNTAFVSSSELTVSGLVPSTLALGTYDLTVTNPGGTPLGPLKFNVNEGKPVLDSMSPSGCVEASATFAGTVSGSYLYPTSAVHVSSVSIPDSVLGYSCLNGTNALGQCEGGLLRVSQDLSDPNLLGVTFTVKVVNPGTPPLESANKPTIKVQASCP